MHKDLKLENVMLMRANDFSHLKLIDFGLAEKYKANNVNFNLDFFDGTAEYIAPEIVSGHKFGSECDMWSLGILIYKL